ncbi:hypothetical protein EVAR_69399_1 [Eumeta japonica]|uniref:Uncharacterized protein n=1 Tax=Eumeta variegata TaxID=151549 RepID=A0A4C1TI51_EUMVA|nr:hypothetical protein EVAR_69399_1 [Eumeta japonica]
MLGLKFCTTTAKQLLKRTTFSTCHAVRQSSSNATAVEAASSSSNVSQSGEEIETKTKIVSSQDSENVKKQKHYVECIEIHMPYRLKSFNFIDSLVAAAFENLKDDSVAKSRVGDNGNIEAHK